MRGNIRERRVYRILDTENAMGKKNILEVKDLAALLKIPVVKVQRWVHQGRIPCKFKGNRYYFKRKEILDWARTHDLVVAEEAQEKAGSSPDDHFSLKRCIERGGVFFDLEGDDIYGVLKNAVGRMNLPPQLEREQIFEELVDREEIASTGIGKGVAIPHPRRSLDLKIENPVISVFFLKERVDFNAIDEKPVFVLFFMFSPSTRIHLKLLSRLSFLLREKKFLQGLETCKKEHELMALIEGFEKAIGEGKPER